MEKDRMERERWIDKGEIKESKRCVDGKETQT